MVDVDDMPAGHEMDALVAERVMGLVRGADFGRWPEHVWRRDVHGEVENIECGGNHSGPHCDRCHYGYCRHCADEAEAAQTQPCEIHPPSYSANITAAWMVVEKLQSLGLSTSILSDWHGNRRCRISRRSEVVVDAANWSETAALAICRAALQASAELQRRGSSRATRQQFR